MTYIPHTIPFKDLITWKFKFACYKSLPIIKVLEYFSHSESDDLGVPQRVAFVSESGATFLCVSFNDTFWLSFNPSDTEKTADSFVAWLENLILN